MVPGDAVYGEKRITVEEGEGASAEGEMEGEGERVPLALPPPPPLLLLCVAEAQAESEGLPEGESEPRGLRVALRPLGVPRGPLALGEKESEAEGDTLAPRVFALEDGPVVLAFDSEDRLAEFTGAPAPYAVLPGRVIAAQLAGQGGWRSGSASDVHRGLQLTLMAERPPRVGKRAAREVAGICADNPVPRRRKPLHQAPRRRVAIPGVPLRAHSASRALALFIQSSLAASLRKTSMFAWE
jgi:hypothetical protein